MRKRGEIEVDNAAQSRDDVPLAVFSLIITMLNVDLRGGSGGREAGCWRDVLHRGSFLDSFDM